MVRCVECYRIHPLVRSRDKGAVIGGIGSGYVFCPSFLFYQRFACKLPTVFSVPTRVHAAHQFKSLPHTVKKYILRMKVDPLPAHTAEHRPGRLWLTASTDHLPHHSPSTFSFRRISPN